jgi:hypothetical protein
LCRQVSELITSRQFCRIGLGQPHQILARNLAAARSGSFGGCLPSKPEAAAAMEKWQKLSPHGSKDHITTDYVVVAD